MRGDSRRSVADEFELAPDTAARGRSTVDAATSARTAGEGLTALAEIAATRAIGPELAARYGGDGRLTRGP